MRILLAEDNPDDAFILQEAFVYAGVHATISLVEDGETLLARLSQENIADDFDVTVVDATLPRRPSLEALQKAIALRGGLPLPTVIMTGVIAAGQRSAYEEIGVSAVMAKPLELDGYNELIECVQTLVQKRRAKATSA